MKYEWVSEELRVQFERAASILYAFNFKASIDGEMIDLRDGQACTRLPCARAVGYVRYVKESQVIELPVAPNRHGYLCARRPDEVGHDPLNIVEFLARTECCGFICQRTDGSRYWSSNPHGNWGHEIEKDGKLPPIAQKPLDKCVAVLWQTTA